MQPVCVYDATTQHYIVVPPNKLNNSVPAVKSQISQQKPVKPPQPITQQDHTGNAQSVNAGQSVVVQQRNVSHLVQVRTPQGLKLYRLASPGGGTGTAAVAATQQAAAAASIQNSGGRLIMTRPQQQQQQPQVQPQPQPQAAVVETNHVQSQAA